MWLSPVTLTAPTAEPVDLAKAKQYLRIDAGDESFDDEVETFIAASRAEVETICNTRMITQEVLLIASTFADLEHLPIGPVQSIDAVHYIDANGEEQLVDEASYALVGGMLDARIVAGQGFAWPVARTRVDAVRVTATVGYGDAGTDLPRDLYLAILQGVRAHFDGRNLSMERLLVNHRIWLS
ncbi:hypothetical protein [Blastomonas sp.]|uniref:head-tail connector protein n=1 Tax=Blastomonas sp. TaxID=1909299 RepID=UPI00391D3E77